MAKPGKCVACGRKFQQKKKGYKRFSLKSQLGQSFDVDVSTALSQALPEMTDKVPDEGHVCDSCFRLLRTTLRQREQLLKTEIEWELRLRNGPQGKHMSKSRTKGKVQKSESRRTKKRKLGEVQNIMSNSDSISERRRKRMKLEPTVAVLCKNGGHKNYMKKAIAYLIQYRYHKAFRMIIDGSERAKKAFIGVMEKEIRKETFYFCKKADKFSQEETALETFSWKKELKKMEHEMPTFYSACHATMDKRKGPGSAQSGASSLRKRKRLIRPRLGLMMTLPLYTRRERKFGFVMNILSLLFHRYGSHEKMLKILRNLGVCHRNSKPLIRKVDGMKTEECEKLLAWAVKNLAEVKSSDGLARKSSHKGKAPKAQLPPTDSDLSEDSGSDDVESDDENMQLDDDDDEDDDDEEEEEDDDDDDDDSSLLSLLSSDESDTGEDDGDDGNCSNEAKEEEEEEEGKKEEVKMEEVREEQVEVEGWVEEVEGEEVQIQTLVRVFPFGLIP